jgi:HEAT repeats
MRRATWLALMLIACGHRTVTPMNEQANYIRDPEVEKQIMLLETPFGDGPHQRERERAKAWLVANADRAYPQIAARMNEGRASVAVIELLPRFERAESIPLLERLLLVGPEATAWTAGQALALHPHASAGEALRRSLASREPAVAVIAADGIGTRGDSSNCAALTTLIDAPDARVRYHVVQAAGKLGCLAREALELLTRSDPDADVRDLATKLLDQQ